MSKDEEQREVRVKGLSGREGKKFKNLEEVFSLMLKRGLQF